VPSSFTPNTSIARAAEGGGSHFIDLAIDTYSPPANALATAETRAREYWAKHQKEIGRDTRYLAVQSYTSCQLMCNAAWMLLWPKDLLFFETNSTRQRNVGTYCGHAHETGRAL
jgi:hypothetical protein